MHNDGILHRDIKLANIFLKTEMGTDGKPYVRAKLGDYGFSVKVEAEHMTHIELKTYLGTALYMAPELLDQETYNYQTDIFAIGIVAYKLLYLVTPFQAENKFELRKLLDIGVVCFDPERVKGGLSMDMVDFIMGCLMYNRVNRTKMDSLMSAPILCKKYEEVAMTKCGPGIINRSIK